MKKSYCGGLNKCGYLADKCWGMVINYGYGFIAEPIRRVSEALYGSCNEIESLTRFNFSI